MGRRTPDCKLSIKPGRPAQRSSRSELRLILIRCPEELSDDGWRTLGERPSQDCDGEMLGEMMKIFIA